MGPKQVNEFSMVGTMVPADEAKRLGIINRLVPREKLDEGTMQLADVLLLKSPWALARIKWLNYRQPNLSINDALDQGTDQAPIWLQLPDVKEGVSAFLNKRKADFEQFKGKIKFVG